jgi:hypothetical protein
LGASPLRWLDQHPEHFAAQLCFSPYAFIRCTRELTLLLHARVGAAPYHDPLTRYSLYLSMARLWCELERVRDEQDAREDPPEQGA